jgi:choline dehydrogenase-like flavoprotein
VVFGQARLLVKAAKAKNGDGCRNCGECMSGCVYGAIYKSSIEIKQLHDQNKITYMRGCLVNAVDEKDGKVKISYFDEDGNRLASEFDRAFLAAGAVNSTRIMLNSSKLYGKKVQLKTRGGFVLPVFSLKKLKTDWPKCNTQPGLFLELKGKGLKHWIHIQISTANELLIKKLKTQGNPTGTLSRIKRFVADHTIVTLVNYHSDHSGHYDLWISPPADVENTECLHTRHLKKWPQFGVLFATVHELLRIFPKIGLIPLFPFARSNSGSYHAGCTFPMKRNPVSDLETDIVGRTRKWRRVHIVDSSVFPSLPGTTIGLLIMANAYRIVDKTISGN